MSGLDLLADPSAPVSDEEAIVPTRRPTPAEALAATAALPPTLEPRPRAPAEAEAVAVALAEPVAST